MLFCLKFFGNNLKSLPYSYLLLLAHKKYFTHNCGTFTYINVRTTFNCLSPVVQSLMPPNGQLKADLISAVWLKFHKNTLTDAAYFLQPYYCTLCQDHILSGANAAGTLQIRQVIITNYFFFSWRYDPHWGLYFTAL